MLENRELLEIFKRLDFVLHEEDLSQTRYPRQFLNDVVLEPVLVNFYLFSLRSMAANFQGGRLSREVSSHCLRINTLTFLNRSRYCLMSSVMVPILMPSRLSMLRLSGSFSRRALISLSALILVYIAKL